MGDMTLICATQRYHEQGWGEASTGRPERLSHQQRKMVMVRMVLNVREKQNYIRTFPLRNKRVLPVIQKRWTGAGLRAGSSSLMFSGTKKTAHRTNYNHRSKKPPGEELLPSPPSSGPVINSVKARNLGVGKGKLSTSHHKHSFIIVLCYSYLRLCMIRILV